MFSSALGFRRALNLQVLQHPSSPVLKSAVKTCDQSGLAHTGKVSSVKNQGQCGAVGHSQPSVPLKGRFRLQTTLLGIPRYGTGLQCRPVSRVHARHFWLPRGISWLCFEHIIKNGGIDSNEDWPYLSDDCNAAKEKFEKVASIVSFSNVTENDEADLRRHW